MTMYTGGNYGYHMTEKPQPSWMKGERYEYCEPYIDSYMARPVKKKTLFHSFLSMLTGVR